MFPNSSDDNADISLVPVFQIKGRPAPAVYCPNVGGGEFLLGTHVILYTTSIQKSVSDVCCLILLAEKMKYG